MLAGSRPGRIRIIFLRANSEVLVVAFRKEKKEKNLFFHNLLQWNTTQTYFEYRYEYVPCPMAIFRESRIRSAFEGRLRPELGPDPDIRLTFRLIPL